jgi:hypothetical protein
MKKILLLSSVLFLTGCWQDRYYLHIAGIGVMQDTYSSLAACEEALKGIRSYDVGIHEHIWAMAATASQDDVFYAQCIPAN